MGHEIAAEIIEAPASSGFAPGEIVAVNPYLACGTCKSCRAGKPNCCVNISVLGVHRDGAMTELVRAAARKPAARRGPDHRRLRLCRIPRHRRPCRPARRRLARPIMCWSSVPVRSGSASPCSPVSPAHGCICSTSIPNALPRPKPLPAPSPFRSNGDIADAISELTGGAGFDVVLDATGNRHAMEKGFDYVAHGGRYVLVSVVPDAISFADPLFHGREMTLFGSRNADTEDFAHVIASIRAGKVPLDRIITHRTSLEDAVIDLPRWATEKSGLIKALIEI